VDKEIFGVEAPEVSRLDVLMKYREFVVQDDDIAGRVVKPLICFFQNEVGKKNVKQIIS